MSAGVSSAGETAAQQHELLGVGAKKDPSGFVPNSHPGAAWFPHAGLGLFIHWGIASVHGRTDLSWSMIKNTPWSRPDDPGSKTTKVTPEEYWSLAPRFQPDRYDPDPWLAAAKDAGFTYAVLTTKHHDGYTLWPSRFGDMGTHRYMNGRDLVRPFVEACRRHGLKVGLYYSPPDWWLHRDYLSFDYRTFNEGRRNLRHNGFEGLGLRHEPKLIPPVPDLAKWHAHVEQYIGGQVEELLSAYGQIDLLWFDGKSVLEEAKPPISVERLRQLQPQIVINPRLCGEGDFATFECRMPQSKPQGLWEVEWIWNVGGWGYLQDEIYAPAAEMIELYQRARAWDGNLLLNIGPRPNGELPPIAYQRMTELGAWMRKNRKH